MKTLRISDELEKSKYKDLSARIQSSMGYFFKSELPCILFKMDKWGVSYDDLKEICRLSGFGLSLVYTGSESPLIGWFLLTLLPGYGGHIYERDSYLQGEKVELDILPKEIEDDKARLIGRIFLNPNKKDSNGSWTVIKNEYFDEKTLNKFA